MTDAPASFRMPYDAPGDAKVQVTVSAPPPILGGSRVYCPMVDVAAIETGRKRYLTSIHDLTCYWHKRGQSARVLKAYRRHWYRKHWTPFTADPFMTEL